MNLSGRIAIVTGASRGIGRACALKIASRGAKVVVNYMRSQAAADNVVADIREKGGEAIPVQGDVSQFAVAQALVSTTVEAYGRIDILVNNAGARRDNLLAIMREEEFDSVIQNNLKSVFNMSAAVLRQMMKQQYGRIVNMASIAGVVGSPGQTNYSASKAGIIGFTKAMARECGPKNIAVNAVAPGYIQTDMTDALPQDIKDGVARMTALRRMGSAEEVANVVAFLVSDDASYVTGQVIATDGGLT